MNISKCKFLSFGNSLDAAYTIIDPTTGDRVQLSECSEEKDLGIWYTSDLKPSTQCRKAVAKAMQALGLIKRSFKFISNESFLVLYKLYVRPALEYCASAWSPYLLKDIDLMEQVQHRATKLVKGIADLPYEEQLTTLGLHSLFCRRQRGDLIETYKIINKVNDVQVGFTLSNSSRTRGHPYKLVKQRSHLDLQKHFFTNRIIDQWNHLPPFVVTADNINLFKSRLDSYWDTIGYGQLQRPLAY